MLTYNHNGSLTNATNDVFTSAAYHKHSCLPIRITGSGGSATLCYDSMGRRAMKNGSVKVSYRRGVDGGIVPLSENVGGEEVVYIETPSGHRLSRSSKVYYIHSIDHLGSARVRINATECVSAMYSAYGECIVTGGRTTPLRYTFTGYELDTETNQMNAWRRLYSPKLGRFVMVDSKLQYASPYIYCNGDPFNHTDPTGEISSAVISGIISATIFIATIIISVATLGIATPEAVTSDVPAVAAAEGQAKLSLITMTSMARTVSGYALVGGLIAAGSTAVSNAAGLVTKAASGEHVSAWQGVKAMLVEPAIAFVTGAIGGAITGKGTLAFAGPFVTLMSFAAGAAVTTASSSLISDAIDKRKVDGAELGLQLGIAVAEAMIMMPFFAAIHPMASTQGRAGNTVYYTNQINNYYDERMDADGSLHYGVGAPKRNMRVRMKIRMKYLRWSRPRNDAQPPAAAGNVNQAQGAVVNAEQMREAIAPSGQMDFTALGFPAAVPRGD